MEAIDVGLIFAIVPSRKLIVILIRLLSSDSVVRLGTFPGAMKPCALDGN